MAEWEAYMTLEPHGEERGDWNTAQICTLLANINRNSKSRPTPYQLKDFILDFYVGEEESQTPEAMKGVMMGWVKAKEKDTNGKPG